jgi:hypothetical protein
MVTYTNGPKVDNTAFFNGNVGGHIWPYAGNPV